LGGPEEVDDPEMAAAIKASMEESKNSKPKPMKKVKSLIDP